MKKINFTVLILSISISAFSQNKIESIGNVGIGTTSPNEPLEVAGTGRMFIGNGGGVNRRGILFQGTGTYARIIAYDYGLSTGVDLVLQDSGGNVGIGTTSPNEPLEVAGTGRMFIGNGGGVNRRGILFQGTGTYARIIAYDYGLSTGVDLVLQDSGGNVGIGTTEPQSKLAVNGQIRATEIKVLVNINVPDYVFEEGYELRTLKETKEYIAKNKHLPEIPSASEIRENGINLGDMNMRLLKKIEELTLHLIEQNERMEKMEKDLQRLTK